MRTETFLDDSAKTRMGTQTNMKPLISFVVPIYNVEQFLPKCLDSIYELSQQSIELVLVNDGASDSSGEIMARYHEQFPAITKLITQENKGLSAARNKGLDNASGEWIAFIDSDDFIDSKAMLNVIKVLQQTDSDIIAFDGYRYIDASAKLQALLNKPNPYNNGETVKSIDYLTTLIDNSITNVVTVWDKIYKKSIIDKYDMRFISGMLHEDVPFTFKLLCNDNKLTYIAEKVLYYRQREGSIVNTPASIAKAHARITNIFYIIDLLKVNNISNVVLNDYLVFIAKTVAADKFALPYSLLFSMGLRRISVKKRLILIWIMCVNLFLKQVKTSNEQ